MASLYSDKRAKQYDRPAAGRTEVRESATFPQQQQQQQPSKPWLRSSVLTSQHDTIDASSIVASWWMQSHSYDDDGDDDDVDDDDCLPKRDLLQLEDACYNSIGHRFPNFRRLGFQTVTRRPCLIMRDVVTLYTSFLKVQHYSILKPWN